MKIQTIARACALGMIAMSGLGCKSEPARTVTNEPLQDALIRYKLAFREYVGGQTSGEVFSIDTTSYWRPLETSGYISDISVGAFQETNEDPARGIRFYVSKQSWSGLKDAAQAAAFKDQTSTSLSVDFYVSEIVVGKRYECTGSKLAKKGECAASINFSTSRKLNDLNEYDRRDLFSMGSVPFTCAFKIREESQLPEWETHAGTGTQQSYTSLYVTSNLQRQFSVAYECYETNTRKTLLKGSYAQGAFVNLDQSL